MENLSGHTEIQLVKLINDIKIKHDTLKQEVIDHTFEIDVLTKKVNEKLIVIEQLEKNYVELIEELSTR